MAAKNILEAIEEQKGNVRPFVLSGIEIFDLNKRQLRNLIAILAEQRMGFTLEWEKNKIPQTP